MPHQLVHAFMSLDRTALLRIIMILRAHCSTCHLVSQAAHFRTEARVQGSKLLFPPSIKFANGTIILVPDINSKWGGSYCMSTIPKTDKWICQFLVWRSRDDTLSRYVPTGGSTGNAATEQKRWRRDPVFKSQGGGTEGLTEEGHTSTKAWISVA